MKAIEVYKNLLNETIVVVREIGEIAAVGLFVAALILTVPFIPFIMLGRFICDKVEERRKRDELE